MADELRLLCDEMLAGLGRWLRLAGYDTEIAERGCRDRDILEQAHANRIGNPRSLISNRRMRNSVFC